MANIVLALQGGAANGSEPTFDGQPMQKGVHLRWSFLAALGFPPGGFWLCRRAAKQGEEAHPAAAFGYPASSRGRRHCVSAELSHHFVHKRAYCRRQ